MVRLTAIYYEYVATIETSINPIYVTLFGKNKILCSGQQGLC